MEKLKQLLNEYYPLDGWEKEYYIKDSEIYVRDYGDCFFINHGSFTLNVISKRFWFIEWLVDQNKIEFDRARDRSDSPLLYAGWWEFYSDSEVIIATLSVEDNPIEFLVSILK